MKRNHLDNAEQYYSVKQCKHFTYVLLYIWANINLISKMYIVNKAQEL